jgi:hypothetical protein
LKASAWANLQESLDRGDLGTRGADALHVYRRLIEVRHRIAALDMTEGDVAGDAEQSPHTPATRTVLFLRSRVVMIHVNALSLHNGWWHMPQLYS